MSALSSQYLVAYLSHALSCIYVVMISMLMYALFSYSCSDLSSRSSLQFLDADTVGCTGSRQKGRETRNAAIALQHPLQETLRPQTVPSFLLSMFDLPYIPLLLKLSLATYERLAHPGSGLCCHSAQCSRRRCSNMQTSGPHSYPQHPTQLISPRC